MSFLNSIELNQCPRNRLRNRCLRFWLQNSDSLGIIYLQVNFQVSGSKTEKLQAITNKLILFLQATALKNNSQVKMVTPIRTPNSHSHHYANAI